MGRQRPVAGLVVAKALTTYNPDGGATFKTYVRQMTEYAVKNLLRRERRNEHHGEVFWDGLPARASVDPGDEWDEVTDAILDGATVETVERLTGLSAKRAGEFMRRVLSEAA